MCFIPPINLSVSFHYYSKKHVTRHRAWTARAVAWRNNRLHSRLSFVWTQTLPLHGYNNYGRQLSYKSCIHRILSQIAVQSWDTITTLLLHLREIKNTYFSSSENVKIKLIAQPKNCHGGSTALVPYGSMLWKKKVNVPSTADSTKLHSSNAVSRPNISGPVRFKSISPTPFLRRPNPLSVHVD